MSLLKLCAVVSQFILIHGLIYPEHPILDVDDEKGGVPVKLLADRGDLDNVGLVIHSNSVKDLTSKTSTLGKYFKDEFYFPKPPNRDLSLCSPIDKTPAVFLSGTGFIIGKCQFATAYHVVECLLNPETKNCKGGPQQKLPVKPNNKNVQDIRIVFNYIQSSSGTMAKPTTYSVKSIAFEDSAKDLIVLTTNTFNHSKQKKGPLKLASRVPTVNEQVYMLGHPLGMPMRYTTGKVVESDPKGGFAKYIISGFSGNSGSPIMDHDGNVIGLFAFYNDNANAVDFEFNEQQKCYVFNKKANVKTPVLVSGPPAVLMKPNAATCLP